tara:strand:- start:305 stop:526 length:222 start_codon:yes stop_codon:yes gene_type:complete
MFSTKHTREVNQTYFEHLTFAYGLFSRTFVGSMHFLLHGITGGLYNAPDKYSLYSITRFLSEQSGDLSKRKLS